MTATPYSYAALHASAEYDLSQMVQRYVDLYETALGRGLGSMATLAPERAS